MSKTCEGEEPLTKPSLYEYIGCLKLLFRSPSHFNRGQILESLMDMNWKVALLEQICYGPIESIQLG